MDNTNEKKFEKLSEIIDYEKARNHFVITKDDINVYFPYKPYECQITYIKNVINSLSTGYYAALESPTGTGKTLCLLCACCAWMNEQRKKGKKIKLYYSTRTHSQITNVIKELRQTCYKPDFAILSSRVQSCVHDHKLNHGKLKSNEEITDICYQLRRNYEKKLNSKKEEEVEYLPTCFYYQHLKENFCPIEKEYQNIDIEDLCKLGKDKLFCPYYLEKELSEDADIVFLPYNYIVNKQNFGKTHNPFTDAIIVIDEAHNLPNICSQQNTISLTEELLNRTKDIYNHYKDNKIKLDTIMMNNIDWNYHNRVVDLIYNAIHTIPLLDIGDRKTEKKRIINPSEFINIFYDESLLPKRQTTLDSFCNMAAPTVTKDVIDMNTIDHYIDWLTRVKKNKEVFLCSEDSRTIDSWKKFVNFIKNFINKEIKSRNESKGKNSYSIYYTFFIKENGYGFREILLYCFNPGLCFKKIIKQKPHCIILTSGTLSPLGKLEKELQCPFQIQLSNDHVIDKSQIFFSIISSTKEGQRMSFSYKDRDKTYIQDELGNILLELTKRTPGGILVFFASYFYLRKSYQYLMETKMYQEISKYKKILCDTNQSSSKTLLKLFIEEANTKGAILLSVHRGSSSEGIDFKDNSARLVVLVGVPYACIEDDQIKLKMNYLDKTFKKGDRLNNLTGDEWYTQEAMSAVNQSLGRVIRHINDYGAIIAIDNRFNQNRLKKYFSGWLQKSMREDIPNEMFYDKIQKFFDSMKTKFAPKENNTSNELSEVKDMMSVLLEQYKDNPNQLQQLKALLGSTLLGKKRTLDDNI